MELSSTLPMFLGFAWLLPLASFTLIVLFGPRMGKHGVGAAYVATSAIVFGALFSWASLGLWLYNYGTTPAEHAAAHASADEHGEAAEHDAGDETHEALPKAYTNNLYTLGQFGSLKITISKYIDT